MVLELCLLEGKEGIRGKVDEKDGIEKYSVYDTINLVTGRNLNNDYGRHTYYSLIEEASKFKDEVGSLKCDLKFKGRGQRNTPCMTLRGLQRLVMILGGKVAAKYRAIAETTLTRMIAR